MRPTGRPPNLAPPPWQARTVWTPSRLQHRRKRSAAISSGHLPAASNRPLSGQCLRRDWEVPSTFVYLVNPNQPDGLHSCGIDFRERCTLVTGERGSRPPPSCFQAVHLFAGALRRGVRGCSFICQGRQLLFFSFVVGAAPGEVIGDPMLVQRYAKVTLFRAKLS